MLLQPRLSTRTLGLSQKRIKTSRRKEKKTGARDQERPRESRGRGIDKEGRCRSFYGGWSGRAFNQLEAKKRLDLNERANNLRRLLTAKPGNIYTGGRGHARGGWHRQSMVEPARNRGTGPRKRRKELQGEEEEEARGKSGRKIIECPREGTEIQLPG